MHNRRQFLQGSGLLCGAAASGFGGGLLAAGRTTSVDPNSNLAVERYALAACDAYDPMPLRRIAFGSCANQDKSLSIFQVILDAQPDLFMFLGDNVYADTRDATHLVAQYRKLADKKEFQALRANTQLLAVWDDHDYGENDAGFDYPLKNISKQTFLDFWQEPVDSKRRWRDGIYTSRVFGPLGARVQIIMPDLRFNRSPLTVHDLGRFRYEEWEAARRSAGLPVQGPYGRCAERHATMLGERQWRWLEQQLEIPADVRIFASSLQVLADFPGWEAWINFACDHQRLIDLIRRKNAAGMIFVSGDTHYAELSKLDLNVPYTLWDLTCSGLTEVWDVDVPNANRVGAMLRQENFGLVEIDWTQPDPVISLHAVDRFGTVRIAKRLRLSELQPA